MSLRWARPLTAVCIRDEFVMLAPALTLLVVVSAHQEFNVHLRYVFPSLALMLIFLGQIGREFVNRITIPGVLGRLFVIETMVSLFCIYPHQLAYFNEFAGGPRKGHDHLLGSSLDWGQDLLYLRAHLAKTGETPVELRGSFVNPDLIRAVIPQYGSLSSVRPVTIVSPNCMASGGNIPGDAIMVTSTFWKVVEPPDQTSPPPTKPVENRPLPHDVKQ